MNTNRTITGRTLAAVILASSLMISFVALIVASPWLTRAAVDPSDDWRGVSDIGQAYGGVSAILSGLAFCGIAGSLILQWRQVRQSHVMTARERHFELMRLTLEGDPGLLAGLLGVPDAVARQWVIRNLWVAHWAMLWETGALTLPQLRREFDDFFRDETSRAWWTAVGLPRWRDESDEAFIRVATESYDQTHEGPAEAGSEEDG
jgi:uncharacterized protein DUF6082